MSRYNAVIKLVLEVKTDETGRASHIDVYHDDGVIVSFRTEGLRYGTIRELLGDVILNAGERL